MRLCVKLSTSYWNFNTFTPLKVAYPRISQIFTDLKWTFHFAVTYSFCLFLEFFSAIYNVSDWITFEKLLHL
jgi:hypothetical protein